MLYSGCKEAEMGALGILQEKSVGKDAEQSIDTSENVDFDCRIFELKVS